MLDMELDIEDFEEVESTLELLVVEPLFEVRAGDEEDHVLVVLTPAVDVEEVVDTDKDVEDDSATQRIWPT